MLETVIGILLIVMGVFLVIAVLMQSSKNHKLSGSIAGGAETFFGKEKGKTIDAMLNKITTVVTIVFVVLVLTLFIIQPSAEEVYQKYLIENGLVDADGNLINDGTTFDIDDLLAEEEHSMDDGHDHSEDEFADDEAIGDTMDGAADDATDGNVSDELADEVTDGQSDDANDGTGEENN